MDTFGYIRDLLFAAKTEVLRYRGLVALIFTLILGILSAVAIHWPKYYISNAAIVKDVTNVIEPLLRGAASVTDLNKNEKIRDVIYARRLMSKVALQMEGGAGALTPEQMELKINEIRSSLVVQSLGRGSVLTNLTYKAANAEEAYKALTIIVDVFISDRMEDKQRKSNEAHDFISQQADNYKRRLEAAELTLKEFKSKSVDVSEAQVKDRIGTLSLDIEALRISIDESKEKIRSTSLQAHEESKDVSLRVKFDVLESRRATVETSLNQLRLKYQDSYPDVIALEAQLAKVVSEIAILTQRLPMGHSARSDLPLLEELRKQLASAKVSLKVQQRRLIAYESLLAKEHKLADVVAEKQAKLLDLTRDYRVTKKLYEQMLSRKENAKLTLALNDEGQGESYKLVDPPSFPLRPSGLRALYIFLVAPLAAFCVPIGLAGLLVVFDARMRSSVLMRSKLPSNIYMLAKIPHRGSPLSAKLFRKDVFILGFLALAVVGGYFYTFFLYKDVL